MRAQIKKIQEIFVATAITMVGVAFLTACNGGGGGGGATAAAPGGPPPGSISSTNTYVGTGAWHSRLAVTNMQVYQNVLASIQPCNCWPDGFFGLTVDTQNADSDGIPGGVLPGPAVVRIDPYKAGVQLTTIRLTVDAYSNGSPNGMIVIYNQNSWLGGWGGGGGNGWPGGGWNNGWNQPGWNQPGVAPNYNYNYNNNNALIQINAQFTDGTHNYMNVQVLSRNVQFAAGTLWGNANYNPTMSNPNTPGWVPPPNSGSGGQPPPPPPPQR